MASLQAFCIPVEKKKKVAIRQNVSRCSICSERDIKDKYNALTTLKNDCSIFKHLNTNWNIFYFCLNTEAFLR